MTPNYRLMETDGKEVHFTNTESEVLEQTIQNLTESNQRLEAENTLLQLKNNLLLDMLSLAKLDLISQTIEK
ncbi:hypothetical protein HDV01_006857 [Terramyces sp. JEL0728]|nr:hypothetical protein HDV01_006857 [Terramyces sp. JEL0728]